MAKITALVVLSILVGAFGASIRLSGVARDFTPTHPDFQNSAQMGDCRNSHAPFLDGDRKPVLLSSHQSCFTNPSRFSEWYRDIDGTNIPVAIEIELTDIGNGIYSYSSNSFFPVDNLAFGNWGGSGHNFHFTTEFHTTFTYNGGETFTFTGDDDVYVFINNKLAINLGGVHGAETGFFVMDSNAQSFGLVAGQTYPLDVFHAERHTTESNFRIDTTLVLTPVDPHTNDSTPGRDAYICEVLYENFCPGSPVGGSERQGACPNDPYIAFQDGGIAYSLEHFNAISFGSFIATTSDIEGRLAVAKNLSLGNGYSVGYELRTGGVNALDDPLPFALVVGGDASWGSGSIHPDGTGIPYEGQKENIYVGGTFTAPSYLQDRRTGGPAPGYLNSAFQNAQAYYTRLSEAHFTAPQGLQATATIQWGTITITCPSNAASAYWLSVNASSFSTITSWTEVNCNPQAQVVINIGGSGQVKFAGSHFYHKPEKVLYNVHGPNVVRVETQVGGTILAPQAVYRQPGMGVVVGKVIAADVPQSHQINRLDCATPAPPVHPPVEEDLCPGFETECPGLNIAFGNSVFSLREYNVISFDSFTANTGDVEGRLLARRDVSVGAGYTVGWELQTANNQPDASLPYSLVAGRDISWISGSVHPDGTGHPYPGNREDIFAGRNFTGAWYLAERRTGGPCQSPGCLDTQLDAALSCYKSYQTELGSHSDNVITEFYWSGLFITCNDVESTHYYVTLDGSDFSKFTWTTLDNCNLQSSWTINIRGTGDFSISGASFPAIPGGVVYNVLGSGRTVKVHDTAVTGHMLLPENSLNQESGVIIGKVVAGNIIFSLQINKQNTCPEDGEITISTTSTESSTGTQLAVYRLGGFREGDAVEGPNGQTGTVVAVSNNPPMITLDSDMTLGVGDRISAKVSRANGRPRLPEPEGNGSVSLKSAVFVVFALVMLLF